MRRIHRISNRIMNQQAFLLEEYLKRTTIAHVKWNCVLLALSHHHQRLQFANKIARNNPIFFCSEIF